MTWEEIKTEYVTSDISYRALAEKSGVPFKTLAIRARDGNWVQLREQYKDKFTTKQIAAVAQKQIDRYANILDATDKLLAKINESIAMLEAQDIVCDKSGIRALAGAIKDIKDIQSLKSDLDRAEQEARIEKLRKESGDEMRDNTVTVKIVGGADDFAK